MPCRARAAPSPGWFRPRRRTASTPQRVGDNLSLRVPRSASRAAASRPRDEGGRLLPSAPPAGGGSEEAEEPREDHSAAGDVAAALGVSARTVERAIRVAEEAPELLEPCFSGAGGVHQLGRPAPGGFLPWDGGGAAEGAKRATCGAGAPEHRSNLPTGTPDERDPSLSRRSGMENAPVLRCPGRLGPRGALAPSRARPTSP